MEIQNQYLIEAVSLLLYMVYERLPVDSWDPVFGIK